MVHNKKFRANCSKLGARFSLGGADDIQTLHRPADAEGRTAPFVRMTFTVHNTGRTSATITKAYGQFSHTFPAGNKPFYWNGTKHIMEFSVAAGLSFDLAPFFFETDSHDPQFFWGYLEYFDIFKVKHLSRVCAAVFPSDPPGPGKFQLVKDRDAWPECD
jgi:hypothetical protein